MAENNLISIEVIYGRADQKPVSLQVSAGTTIEEAIQLSGLVQQFPEIAAHVSQERVGVFSKKVKLQDCVKPNQRVEIYRPLKADPKALRVDRLKEKL